MSPPSKILRDAEGGRLIFWCPGCSGNHGVSVGEGPGPRWGWNGSVDKPTFTPSILVQSTDFTAKGRADYEAWRNAGFPPHPREFESAETVCHSFVTDGRIHFLSDSTHLLAGQTVDLPEFEP